MVQQNFRTHRRQVLVQDSKIVRTLGGRSREQSIAVRRPSPFRPRSRKRGSSRATTNWERRADDGQTYETRSTRKQQPYAVHTNRLGISITRRRRSPRKSGGVPAGFPSRSRPGKVGGRHCSPVTIVRHDPVTFASTFRTKTSSKSAKTNALARHRTTTRSCVSAVQIGIENDKKKPSRIAVAVPPPPLSYPVVRIGTNDARRKTPAGPPTVGGRKRARTTGLTPAESCAPRKKRGERQEKQK